MRRYCTAPACRCLAPCEAYEADQRIAEEEERDAAARRTELEWCDEEYILDLVSEGAIPSEPLTMADLDYPFTCLEM